MCQSGARLSHLSSKGCVKGCSQGGALPGQPVLSPSNSIEVTFGKVYQLERGHKGTFWNAGNLLGLELGDGYMHYTNVKTK